MFCKTSPIRKLRYNLDLVQLHMAKGSKLKDALDRLKGVDKRAQHKKKIQKDAEKRKRSKLGTNGEEPLLEDAVNGGGAKLGKTNGVGSHQSRCYS